jgi:hypothetical protein
MVLFVDLHEDSARLLAKRWMVGRSSMMIKRWRLDFNPDTKSFPEAPPLGITPGSTLTFVECGGHGGDR